jgi:hypothetical protein
MNHCGKSFKFKPFHFAWLQLKIFSASTYSLVSSDGLGLEDEGLSVVVIVFKEFLVVLEEVSPVLKAHILDALK